MYINIMGLFVNITNICLFEFLKTDQENRKQGAQLKRVWMQPS